MFLRKNMNYLHLLTNDIWRIKEIKMDTVIIQRVPFNSSRIIETKWTIEKFLNEMTNAYGLKETAYQLYIDDWMHRISTERQLDARRDFYEMQKENPDLCFDDYIFHYGYDGEIYACFDEFLDAEWRDEEYMEALLSELMYKEYLEEAYYDNKENEDYIYASMLRVADKIREYLQLNLSDNWDVAVNADNEIECCFNQRLMFVIFTNENGAWCISGKEIPLDVIRDILNLLEV